MNADGTNRKSRMCVYQLAGKCFKGTSCGFAHHPEELTNPKQVLCPVVATTGACCDPLCPLAHSDTEMTKPKQHLKKRFCRYFASGKCLAGEFCRHAHFASEYCGYDDETIQGNIFSVLVNMLADSAPPSSSTSL